GWDDYTLPRSGDTVTLRLINSAHPGPNGITETADAGVWSSIQFPLGAGNDTATIDFSGGDPFEGVSSPSISAISGGNDKLIIIGRDIADAITIGAAGSSNRTVSVNTTTSIAVSANVLAMTLHGGAGNDLLDAHLVGSECAFDLDGGAGSDSMYGGGSLQDSVDFANDTGGVNLGPYSGTDGSGGSDE